MPARDPIDDVIAEAERTRGTLPPEPQPEFQPAAWAADGGKSGTSSRRRKSTPFATAALVIVVTVVVVSITAAFFRHEPTQFDHFRVAAEQLITRNLKAPATAKFAPSTEWQFEKIDDSAWRMRAWVDSQNSFGALLRAEFVTIVRSEDSEWRLLYLKLGESASVGTYMPTPAEREAKESAERAQAAAEAAERRLLAEARAAEAAAARAADAAARKTMREQLDEVRAKSTEIDERRDAEEKAAEARRRREEDEANKANLAKQFAEENAKYHKWQTPDGKFSVDAMLVSVAGDVITIEKRDGKRSKVEISKLSEADQSFVETWKRDRQRSK